MEKKSIEAIINELKDSLINKLKISETENYFIESSKLINSNEKIYSIEINNKKALQTERYGFCSCIKVSGENSSFIVSLDFSYSDGQIILDIPDIEVLYIDEAYPIVLRYGDLIWELFLISKDTL